MGYKNIPKRRKTAMRAYRFKHNMIQEIKMLLGCERCGYKKNPSSLDFHHLDPQTKSFEVGLVGSCGYRKLRKEISKCAILCKNCHHELEYPNEVFQKFEAGLSAGLC